MNYHIAFDRFKSTNEFDYIKARSNTKRCSYDQNTRSIKVDKKHLYIDDTKLQIGMGVITFCEVKFLDNIENILKSLDFKGFDTDNFYPKNPNELYYYLDYQVEKNKKALATIIEKHIYTSIFSPVLVKEFEKAAVSYMGHLFNINLEFSEMIELCFDVDFKNDILIDLSGRNRFYLFLKTNPFFTAPNITRSLNYQDTQFEKIDIESRFVSEKCLKDVIVDKLKKEPVELQFDYQCSCLYEMLFLEVFLMIENEVKIKKCARCGKYFPYNGNSEYCTRVETGSTLTCQNIIANEVFKKKSQDKKAFLLYNKFYKRYYERTKVGTIKAPIFETWKYEANAKRIACENNELSITDYEKWLIDSFKNRKKVQNDEK